MLDSLAAHPLGLLDIRLILVPRGEPTQIKAVAPSPTELLKLDFGYGGSSNNGNILSQLINGDELPTFTQTYTYDAVNRIATVGENSNFWQRTYCG